MFTYKNLFPFRIGTTSYVYPADILPNVEKLAPLVDDIELVLFESGTESNLPGPELVRELAALAQANSLTYTVHFPIDLKAGSGDESEREKYASRACSIVERTRELDPYAYIMHFEGIDNGSPAGQILQWRKAVRDTLARMRQKGMRFNRICIENLAYPRIYHEDLTAEFNLLNCCDVGHLWVGGNADWADDCSALMPRTRVIHLHGTHEGNDHLSLEKEQTGRIEKLAECFLRDYRHVLTIETFNEIDTFTSLEALRKVWDKLRL